MAKRKKTKSPKPGTLEAQRLAKRKKLAEIGFRTRVLKGLGFFEEQLTQHAKDNRAANFDACWTFAMEELARTMDYPGRLQEKNFTSKHFTESLRILNKDKERLRYEVTKKRRQTESPKQRKSRKFKESGLAQLKNKETQEKIFRIAQLMEKEIGTVLQLKDIEWRDFLDFVQIHAKKLDLSHWKHTQCLVNWFFTGDRTKRWALRKEYELKHREGRPPLRYKKIVTGKHDVSKTDKFKIERY